jgi:O-antigen/teichoic acid export membrane protein
MWNLARERLAGTGTGTAVARSGGGVLAMRMVGAALALGLHLALARCLGVGEYGVYTYVAAWLLFPVLLSVLGHDLMALRYVAAYRAKHEWGLLKGVDGYSHRTVLALSVGVSGLCALIVYAVGDHLGASLRAASYVGCAMIPPLALSRLRNQILRALHQVVGPAFNEFILVPLTALAGLAACWIAGWPLTAAAMLAARGAGVVLGLVLLTRWLRRARREEFGPRDTVPAYRVGVWFGVALPLLLMSGFGVINNRADAIILGLVRGTDSVGLYTACARLALLLSWCQASINALTAPLFSQMHAQQKHEDLQRLASTTALIVAAISTPLVLVLGGFGAWLLSWFGPEFSAAYPCLLLLLAGQCANVLCGSVGHLLSMTGHQRIAMKVIGWYALANVLLNVLLIPRYGLTGAAFATAFTQGLTNLTLYVFVRRRLGVDASLFSLLRRRRKPDSA